MLNESNEATSTISSTPSIPQKRLDYVDTAKFIAIFLVILCHTIGGQGEIIHFCYSFHLPVFFVLNGITLKVRDNENFGTYLQRKMKSYLIPIFCLGILLIFSEMLLASLNGNPKDISYIGQMIIKLLEQKRVYPLWFVGALFFSDVFFYAVVKFGKNKLPYCSLIALGFLGVAIFFNKFFNYNYVWNIDASLFGVFFVFIGYAFNHQSLTKIRTFLLSKRWISLSIGLVLFGIGYLISEYNFHTYGTYLEMWGRQYQKYYLTLPCAIINSCAFILICSAFRNKIFSECGKSTLVLLAFHQIVTIPLFNNYLANGWYNTIRILSKDDFQYLFYCLISSLFSTLTLLIFYYLIIYSPFSFILNRKMPQFYRDGFHKLKTKLKVTK